MKTSTKEDQASEAALSPQSSLVAPIRKRQSAESAWAQRKKERLLKTASLTNWYAHANVLVRWEWSTSPASRSGSTARDSFTRARKFSRSFGKPLSVSSAKSPSKIEWGTACSKSWSLTYPTTRMSTWFWSPSRVLPQKSFTFSIWETAMDLMVQLTNSTRLWTSFEWADPWTPTWKLLISVCRECTPSSEWAATDWWCRTTVRSSAPWSK